MSASGRSALSMRAMPCLRSWEDRNTRNRCSAITSWASGIDDRGWILSEGRHHIVQRAREALMMSSTTTDRASKDPVSNVLKWLLLATAVGCFALFAWATVLTYERAAPQPDRFVTAGGKTLFTNDDVVAGKVGFQKADLMDYGSLYGMGSYFGQDYTAYTLIGL